MIPPQAGASVGDRAVAGRAPFKARAPPRGPRHPGSPSPRRGARRRRRRPRRRCPRRCHRSRTRACARRRRAACPGASSPVAGRPGFVGVSHTGPTLIWSGRSWPSAETAASTCEGEWVESPTRAASPAIRRASATGASSWPTWTPSAPHASTSSGRSLRMKIAPCSLAASRKGAAAATRSSAERLDRGAGRCRRLRGARRRGAAAGLSHAGGPRTRSTASTPRDRQAGSPARRRPTPARAPRGLCGLLRSSRSPHRTGRRSSRCRFQRRGPRPSPARGRVARAGGFCAWSFGPRRMPRRSARTSGARRRCRGRRPSGDRSTATSRRPGPA